ncbi:MAG: peptide chain release factor 1 [Gammaproteobacteria bacterium]|nr:peptide chain release factor 1 [Gammaproteobacteria bacterium]
MTPTIKQKIEQLIERFEEINRLLADPATIANQTQFKALSKEYAHLEPIVHAYEQCQHAELNLQELTALIDGDDKELAAMAQDEYSSAKTQLATIEHALLLKLIPSDPNDSHNIYLEIRAGTGGDEAAIFAGDLFRMYARYSESRNWHLEIVSAHAGEHGGYKEIIASIEGSCVYADLKFESGAHRVQRVPTTESQGRVHTSACTVAILPEVDEIHDVEIRSDDLKIDTYRSSGAGGQHVNKTDSAIRITHLPSGVVVECQEERSQHKNRAKAMSLLKSRLLHAQQSKQREEQAQARKSLVGSGDRSERIRTYNFPQGRLTDHRINLTLYQLLEVMEGHLNPVIEALKQEHHATLLAELAKHDNHS